MAIRDELREFIRFGPLSSEDDNSEDGDEAFDEMERVLHAIEKPVTDEETQLLAECFGDDNCFGLAWTLLHLVESASSSVVTSEPPEGSNMWIARLWTRYRDTLVD